MSDDATTVLRGAHPGLPLLTDTNFADWDMQVTAYLTGSHDHARVITPIRQADGSYAAPTKPSPAGPNDTPEDVKEADAAISSWNCIASASSGTARQGAPSTTCTSSYATTISNAMPPRGTRRGSNSSAYASLPPSRTWHTTVVSRRRTIGSTALLLPIKRGTSAPGEKVAAVSYSYDHPKSTT